MPQRFRMVGLAILAAMIIGPLLGIFAHLEGAIVVMIFIIVVGFSTVVLVMMIGLMEEEYPHTAEESAAVQAWLKRLAAESDEPNETSAEGES